VSPFSFRLARRVGPFAVVAAALLFLTPLTPSLAQSPAPTPAPAPNAAPAPAAPAPAAPATPQAAPSSEPQAQPGDAFGEGTTLTAKTIVYIKGTGTWDKAFDTITGAFKKIKAYTDKEGLKTSGLPMTIFTATDDTGFDYQAAVPIEEAPKNPPHGEINVGQSPEGQALKFVHHGSYDDLDNTYEAITNYLDEKRLEAKDVFIEEYVTDPVTSDAGKLTVDIYVLIKPPGTTPG
jgi:effector-binding domain-containing protein